VLLHQGIKILDISVLLNFFFLKISCCVRCAGLAAGMAAGLGPFV
jgi:hypothetical protein